MLTKKGLCTIILLVCATLLLPMAISALDVSDVTVQETVDDPVAVFDFYKNQKYITNDNAGGSYSAENKAYKLTGTGSLASKDMGLTPNNSNNNTDNVIAERQAFMDYVEYVNPSQPNPIKYMVLTYSNPDALPLMKTLYNPLNETGSGTRGSLEISLLESGSKYYSVIVDVSGGKLIWRKSVTERATNIALLPFMSLTSSDANMYELYLRSVGFAATVDDAIAFCEAQVAAGNSSAYHMNGEEIEPTTLSVKLDKHIYRMSAGDILTLGVSVDQDASLSYISNNEAVAKVENGVVTALSTGVAKITVTATKGKLTGSDKIKIYVNDIDALEIVKKDGQDAPEIIPKVTFLGDSITAGSQTSKIYHAYLAERLYITAVNKGLSGSNIAGTGSSSQSSFIDRVSTIPADTDLIFVLGGCNDFGQNAGTLERFKPGVRTLIENLIEAFPDKPIVFSTPLQNGGYFSITTNRAGETLEQYVKEIEKACAEYGIPVIKAWRADAFEDFCTYDESGNINGYNSTYYADGVHPNAAGHEVMADFFEEQLEAVGVVSYVQKSLMGDVNGDGTVDSNDNVFLARYCAKWDGYLELQAPLNADVDSDGEIGSPDSVVLARYLAKWSGYESLPIISTDN